MSRLVIVGHCRPGMEFADQYHQFTLWIGDVTGAADDLLHVHAGMAVLIAARLVTRHSLATPIPFAVVCIAELFNEIMDRVSYGSWQWQDTSHDVINTLFWPFVLMIGLRAMRAREGMRAEGKGKEAGTGCHETPAAGENVNVRL